MALTVALTCLGCEWVEARHPVQALSTSPCDLRNETVWEVQVGLDEYNPNPYALTLTRTLTRCDKLRIWWNLNDKTVRV